MTAAPAGGHHFTDLDQLPAPALRGILERAHRRKAARAGLACGAPDPDLPLRDNMLALVFRFPSTRTRLSFDAGIRQLGGQAITVAAADTHIVRGEPPRDLIRVLSRYVDAAVFRWESHHEFLGELVAFSRIPVINALTRHSHPCQIIADVMTIEERLGNIGGRIITWCGDGNNVARSWLHAAAPLGFALRLATPPSLRLPAAEIAAARHAGGDVTETDDVMAAARGAHCVVTDTWSSLGEDPERVAAMETLLRPFQVNRQVMAAAAPDALFLHCLPARRGQEVTDEVLSGPASVVWDEAGNRLHAHKAIILWCLGRES